MTAGVPRGLIGESCRGPRVWIRAVHQVPGTAQVRRLVHACLCPPRVLSLPDQREPIFVATDHSRLAGRCTYVGGVSKLRRLIPVGHLSPIYSAVPRASRHAVRRRTRTRCSCWAGCRSRSARPSRGSVVPAKNSPTNKTARVANCASRGQSNQRFVIHDQEVCEPPPSVPPALWAEPRAKRPAFQGACSRSVARARRRWLLLSCSLCPIQQ